MLDINPQYLTNHLGEKIAAVIPIKEYQSLMEELEDLEDVRLYDEAKKEDDEPSIPIEEAFRMIEIARNSHVE